jgi:LysR family transcriptional regulator, chromosome initiation inhibitor
VTASARAPLIAFDHGHQVEDRYLRRRSRRRLDPPRHYVRSSGAFTQAVRLGFGGLIPDLQAAPADPSLIEFDPGAVVDVPLFWQQWRLRSPLLERVAAAVHEHAARHLQ